MSPSANEAGGFLGALVTVLAFFVPTALLTFVVARLPERLQKWPWRKSIQQGLAPVPIGLLLAGCFTMAKGAIVDSERRLAVCVLLILFRFKINPALLVVAGAIAGVLAFMPK